LIATDLASEGLDLQDADAVVHYDLPWTPLRLEQRVGRIARLGSEHGRADVCWFAPTESIEDRLQLEIRIATKVGRQLQLGVAETSRLGRARIVNDVLAARERLGNGPPGTCLHSPCHAVVRGSLSAAIALLWNIGGRPVPELLILRGPRAQLEHDYEIANSVVQDLVSGDLVDTDPPSELVGGLIATARARLAATYMGPIDSSSRRLARSLVQRARVAGRDRDTRLLRLLDATLDAVRVGLPVGSQRSLEGVLSGTTIHDELVDWLASLPPYEGRRIVGLQLMAAIFGDGSRP